MSPIGTSILGPGPLADPTGASAALLLRTHGIPDRLLDKQAGELLNPPDRASSFADPGRTYPIHAPAAAWASAAAYHSTGSTDPETGRHIKEACDWFGISSEWERLAAGRPTAPEPRPTVKWALPDEKKYPLDHPEQVKAAVDYFSRHKQLFSHDERRTFAGNLVKEAASHPQFFNQDSIWRLEAEAGLGLPHPDWRTELTYRAKLANDVGDLELATSLIKMAMEVNYGGGGLSGTSGAMPSGTFRDAGQLADLLSQVDKRMGWSHEDPMKGLVTDTPSTAKAKLASVTKSASGHWYKLRDLDFMPDELCTDLARMGPIVSRSAKAEMLAKSAAFERLVRAQGINPVESARRPRVDWSAEAGVTG